MVDYDMTFVLEIPPNKVDLTVEALSTIGIEFKPKEQIAIINKDLSDIDHAAMVDDLPNIVDVINKSLEEQRSGYQLSVDYDALQLNQINAILSIGSQHIVWNGSKVLEVNWNWDDGGMDCIDVILIGYPELMSLLIKSKGARK